MNSNGRFETPSRPASAALSGEKFDTRAIAAEFHDLFGEFGGLLRMFQPRQDYGLPHIITLDWERSAFNGRSSEQKFNYWLHNGRRRAGSAENLAVGFGFNPCKGDSLIVEIPRFNTLDRKIEARTSRPQKQNRLLAHKTPDVERQQLSIWHQLIMPSSAAVFSHIRVKPGRVGINNVEAARHAAAGDVILINRGAGTNPAPKTE